MLYCYTCGYGNHDGTRFCYACGRQMLVQSSAYQPPSTPVIQPLPPRTPRKAFVGLTFGILAVVMAISALFGGVGVIIAIICILVGLPLSILGFTQSQIGNRNKGVPTAGLICNSFALFVVVVAALVFAFASESTTGGSADSGSSESSSNSNLPTQSSSSESLSGVTTSGDSESPGQSGIEPSSFEGDGLYTVGVDITPGHYVSSGAVAKHENNGLCEYARLHTREAGMLSGNVRARHAVGIGEGQAWVFITAYDGAFSTTNCGRWRPER